MNKYVPSPPKDIRNVFSGRDRIFEKNIAALQVKNPQIIKELLKAQPRAGVEFVETDEGYETLVLDGVAMASKRKPIHEAQRFAHKINPSEVACCAVVGFGMGYHCCTLLDRLGDSGIVVCFEPDIGLIRAVLERVDYSALISSGRFFMVTNPEDPTRMTQMFKGIEAVIGLGVEIVNHPPSAARLGPTSGKFGEALSSVLKATRTHVITTLANSQVSFRNALMNLDHYAASAGIESLKGVCAGKPAIVVSAGPSLMKNLELLKDPAVRESFVIIAVQTVLKQMLAMGIKPHFVAALDYHEISKRFYEGLCAEDVKGIRLIVEAKANPAILDAFPGEALCTSDELLDELLGEELVRDLGQVEMGGTVAHLCYYFARYLGCDPVILIGQDLGFTDGQYYSANAAIHQVWSGELNAHNSLEMMEWERIVRMKGLLKKGMDIYGRPIYLDEQMSSYLTQFESAFQKDSELGLRVIDASEGGVRKLHSTVSTLDSAIEEFGKFGCVCLPQTDTLRQESDQRNKQVLARIESLIQDAQQIACLSEQSIGLLKEILNHQRDQKRVNKIIGQVQQIRDQVVKMSTAFRLTESVNQVGVLNRLRRDRLIGLESQKDTFDRQRLQVQRDITNVEWTRDAARSVAKQLTIGRDAFVGAGPKETNDLRDTQQVPCSETRSSVRSRSRVYAVVMADPEFGGLGNRRDLGQTVAQGFNAIELTIARLDQAQELDGIVVMTPNSQVVRGLLGSISTKKPLVVSEVNPQRFREQGSRIGSARVQSSECWRGSIGMLSVYDEQFEPALLRSVMNEQGIDGCAVVGADWVLIDPGLVDETIHRFRCQDDGKRIAFSQAVPGIGTFVLDRETVDSLAQPFDSGGAQGVHLATIGALVGYFPVAPQFDPIAKGMCVKVDPVIRDAGVRAMADSQARVEMMREVFTAIGGSPINASSQACLELLGEVHKRSNKKCPRTIVLETCPGRLIGGDWGMWKRRSVEPVERAVLLVDQAHALLKQVGQIREDVAVVFDGVGDPLMHPQAIDFIQLAKEDGAACVEMRSDMLCNSASPKQMIDAGLDILSVDLLAETDEVYCAMTGQGGIGPVYERVQEVFDAMNQERSFVGAFPMWFVPRITRCDAAYVDIEAFYDKWLMVCGSAVIDPLVRANPEQRIQPLPIPARRQQQLDLSTMYIQCDGRVIDRLGQKIRSINVFDEGIERAYQQSCAAMRSSQIELKSTATALTEDHAA